MSKFGDRQKPRPVSQVCSGQKVVQQLMSELHDFLRFFAPAYSSMAPVMISDFCSSVPSHCPPSGSGMTVFLHFCRR